MYCMWTKLIICDVCRCDCWCWYWCIVVVVVVMEEKRKELVEDAGGYIVFCKPT